MWPNSLGGNAHCYHSCGCMFESVAHQLFARKKFLGMRVAIINNHKKRESCVLLVELVRRWPLQREVDGSSLP